MTVIKHQHPFDLNWQAAGFSPTALLTKVLDDIKDYIPLIPQFFPFSIIPFLFIYLFFSLINDCKHIAIINNGTKKEKQRSDQKKGYKQQETQMYSKLPQGCCHVFLPLQQCARLQSQEKRRENKVTILLPKYRDPTLGK